VLLNVATELYGVYGFRQLEHWNVGFESRSRTALCTSHIYRDKIIGIIFNWSWTEEWAKETKRESKKKRNDI
jgi:hypothetical protein